MATQLTPATTQGIGAAVGLSFFGLMIAAWKVSKNTPIPFIYVKSMNNASYLIVVLVLALIVLAIKHTTDVNSAYTYGDALRKSCDGKNMLAETGEYQVFKDANTYRNVYNIVIIYIVTFMLAFLIFNMTFVSWCVQLNVGFVLILILIILWPVLFISNYIITYLNSARVLNLRNPYPDPPMFYRRFRCTWPSSVIISVAIAITIGQMACVWFLTPQLNKEDPFHRYVFIFSGLTMLFLFVLDRAYFPFMYNIMNTVASYSRSAYIFNDALTLTINQDTSQDDADSELYRQYIFKNAYHFNNDQVNLADVDKKTHPFKYVFANEHVVKDIRPIGRTQVLPELRFQTDDAPTAFSSLSSKDMFDAVKGTYQRLRVTVGFVTILIGMSIFHKLYMVSPANTSKMTLISAIAMFIAFVFYRVYLNMSSM